MMIQFVNKIAYVLKEEFVITRRQKLPHKCGKIIKSRTALFNMTVSNTLTIILYRGSSMQLLKNVKLVIAKGLKWILNPPALRDCQIDKTARVCPRSELTNVKVGRYSYVGSQCFAVNASIGHFCSIADRCCIGGATHPMDYVSTSPVFHAGKNIMRTNFSSHSAPKSKVTVIENDVWIGMGCYVKAGVTIHTGAVVGMGSVVTHDIPPYEIWAGNPARFIRKRFDENTIEKLLNSEWRDWSDSKIAETAVMFDDTEKFIQYLERDNYNEDSNADNRISAAGF